MLRKFIIRNNFGFEIYNNKYIFHSAYLLFYPKLIKRLIKNNNISPIIVINICPSKFLAFIEKLFCKKFNIQFYHFPSFKLKNSTVQDNYKEIKKLKKLIDKYIQDYNIWIHCLHGCHRTGLIMSKITKQNFYSELCTQAKRKIYPADIKLLKKLKIID